MSTSAEAILQQALATKQTMDEIIKQDAAYICMICGHSTVNYNKVCLNCESWNGGDGDDD